jgi:hypothetical protein
MHKSLLEDLIKLLGPLIKKMGEAFLVESPFPPTGNETPNPDPL